MLSIPFHQWCADYHPTLNHHQPDAPLDGRMFETFGEEHKTVQASASNRIWTLIETDGEMYIVSGWHFVNRLGYFVTEKPWSQEIHVELD